MRLTRAVPIVSAVATAALALSAASAAAQAPSCSTTVDVSVASTNTAQSVAAMTCLLNAERTTRGLPALTASPELAAAAQAHADDMVARNYKSDVAPAPAPQGSTARDQATTAGYAAANSVYGVWLASGPTAYTNALIVVKQAGLCSTLIDSAYTDVGVGVAVASDGPRFSILFGGQGTVVSSNPVCPAGKLAVAPSQLATAQLLSLQSTGTVAKALGLPSTSSCQSKRAFTIRVKEPIPLRSATLSLPGRGTSKAVRRAGRLRGVVDLRGYPKGKFKLTIRVVTQTGVKLTGARTYRTCQKRNSL